MRADDLIAKDEVYISEQIIASNIAAQVPNLLAYIVQGQRLVYFSSLEASENNYDLESLEFSRHARYPSYEVPWMQFIQGRALHGGGAMEIIYDTSYPLHFRLECLARDELIMPMKTRNINDNEVILIKRPDVYVHQLAAMQFRPEMLEKLTANKKSDDTVCLYKVLCLRPTGLVYAWAALDEGIDDFLTEFRLYSLGLVDPQTLAPKPVHFYPVVLSVQDFTEKKEYYESRGLAAKSRHDQEAIARLKTAVVNGATKAARINSCVDPVTGDDAVTAEITVTANQVVNRRLRYHNTPWPDAVFLSVIDSLRTSNKQQVGQVDFAALNRKDSGKTATEINQAASLQEALATVNTLGISMAVREVYSIGWLIAQSAIRTGGFVNSILSPEFAIGRYRIAAAGDLDVKERALIVEKIGQFLPLAQGTPLYQSMLAKLISIVFPQYANEWVPLLQDNKAAVISALTEVIRALPPEFLATQPPEAQAAINSLLQQADAETGANSPANAVASPS